VRRRGGDRVAEKQPYVLPTCQSALILSISDVAKALNDNDMLTAWECLRTLYFLVPEEVQKAVKNLYEDTVEQLAKIVEMSGVDIVEARVNRRNRILYFLKGRNYELLSSMKNELIRRGYLEKT